MSDRVITIRRGESELLSSDTPISELYNTKLYIVVDDVYTININITLKSSKNKTIYVPDQRIGSLEEIGDLIKKIGLFKENIILQADDGKVMNPQHLDIAQDTGLLNVTLIDPDTVDTSSWMYKENLKKAFNVAYVDNFGMIDKFRLYLNNKHRTWKNNTHNYVPYSTILQNANSTGYPPRTSVGADLFERVLKGLKEEEEWRLLYVLQVAIKCFKEELIKCNYDNEEFWDNQMDTEFCENIWDKVQKESNNWKSIFHDSLISSADFLDDTASDDVCLLFCIDEVRVLLSSTVEQSISPFRLLRRALRGIKWNGFFVLLLDTLSKISNFVPPESADSSSRDTSDTPLKLFYPYFRITTMDVLNLKLMKTIPGIWLNLVDLCIFHI
ncbi:hypothetical protein RclHR1_07320012 [Rhizophagus clarus]|uniref:Uncharacterized protein n=1 Tax=Rhizophagus clarus TaxID=94130 RepID=A0A2Z6SL73_9GLOM|nr:hypothetical protein RclHR1_07320012 [Rhizophagus clarus]